MIPGIDCGQPSPPYAAMPADERPSQELHAPEATHRLCLLGTPRLCVGSSNSCVLQRMGYVLLAALALAKGPVPRRALATMLWPEADATVALARLRRLAYRVEQAVPGEAIAGDGDRLSLGSAQWDTDVRAGARFIQRAHDWSEHATHQTARIWVERLGMPVLDGIESPSEAFEELRRSTSLEMERMRIRLLAEGAQASAAAGRLDDAIGYAESLVQADDLRETSYVLLMRLHAQAGDLASMESTYARCAQRMREEFGIRPSADTEATWAELSRGLASSAMAAPIAPDIRYAGGERGALAYFVLGAGEETLVLAPGFVTHLELGLAWPEIAAFVSELARHRRVVVFDRRGMGLSERLSGVTTVDLLASDLLTVFDSTGVRRGWILGASEGALGAVRFAAQVPDRVSGLILFGALAKGSAASDYPFALPAIAFENWLRRLLDRWGGPAGIDTFAPSATGDAALSAWWARLLRHAITPAGLAEVLRGFRDADVRKEAQELRCPTLVVHRSSDRAVRVEAGRDLANRISGSAFIELEGDDHWWWRGDRAALLAAIERFIACHRAH